jgi:hypothetical protein
MRKPASSLSRSAASGGGTTRGGAVFKLIVFLAVVFAIGALGWMLFLPTLVTSQLRKKSGFDVTVDRLAANPFTGNVEIRGLVVTNPPTFSSPDFLELRAFRARTRVGSLLSEQPVFDQMSIDVAKVTLVKRSDGKTNAQAFQENLKDGRRESLVEREPTKSFLIRKLDLKVDQLVVLDASSPKTLRRDFTLNINQHYEDVTSIEQLVAPDMLKNLAPVATAVGGLLPGDWGRAVSAAGASGTQFLKQVGKKVEERTKGFFDALEESKKP